MPAIKIVCCECGSDDILRDAFAEWDRENQCWELQNVFDNFWCNGCEQTVSTEEAPLETVTMEG